MDKESNMSKQIQHVAWFLLLIFPLSACGSELSAEKKLILEKDSRNQTVDFTLHTDGNDLEYCVNNISGEASSMDVFRVFLHAADQLKEKRFENVRLCFRREARFVLDGNDFAVIGAEYETQNPLYTIRTFPEKLLLTDGTAPYKEHRGGVLYLMRVQMADFQDMNEKWYMTDLITEINSKKDALRPKEFASDDEVF